jgi:Asp-tRNA(Asn)/Glu-tRNA(Gln) amidotransferase A subunit family amidase
VTGPIANSVADLTLLYAVMANTNHSTKPAPGAAALRLPGATEAVAAAAAAPRALGLPRVLLELPEDSSSSLDQVDLTALKPLKGLRVGVFPKVSRKSKTSRSGSKHMQEAPKLSHGEASYMKSHHTWGPSLKYGLACTCALVDA